MGNTKLHFIEVPDQEVSVKDAVESYLFNSQLLSKNSNKMLLVVPQECHENPRVKKYLDKIIELDNPINDIIVFDVKQSMRNGGGPACLRLRVQLTAEELSGVNQKTLLTPERFQELSAWVNKHYRDEIHPDDLRDPQLITESQNALDELTKILDLGNIYSFQKR